MPDFRTGHPRTGLSLSADQSLAAGAQTVVWTNVDFDDAGQFDGTSHITIERNGLYLIEIDVTRASQSTTQQAFLRVACGGPYRLEARTPGAITLVRASASRVIELDAGDSIFAVVQLTTSITATLQKDHTHLTVTRIGPVRYV